MAHKRELLDATEFPAHHASVDDHAEPFLLRHVQGLMARNE